MRKPRDDGGPCGKPDHLLRPAVQKPGLPSCFVSLVHNNQSVRNDYLVPRLQALCEKLAACLSTASWQPTIKPHTYGLYFRREVLYLLLQLQWVRYRELPAWTNLQILRNYLFERFPRYVGVKTALAEWRRRSFIETVVTAKHIMSWRMFLESGCDYMVCCEDDVLFREDSVERLGCFLHDNLAKLSDQFVYADLAGGLSEQELRLDALVESIQADQITYKRPTTNTACCYLLSRSLAGEFLRQILAKPALRLMGIDWMMNSMFMRLRATGDVCECVHFSPTIFGHGTFTGDYVSWQKTTSEQ